MPPTCTDCTRTAANSVRVSIVAENSSRTSLLAMAHPKREQGWRQDGGALDTPVKQSGLARRRIDDDDDDDEADEEAVLDGGVFVFLQNHSNHSKEDESSKEEHFLTDAKETLNALRQRQKKRSEKREDDRCTIEVQTMMSASPSAVVNCLRVSCGSYEWQSKEGRYDETNGRGEKSVGAQSSLGEVHVDVWRNGGEFGFESARV